MAMGLVKVTVMGLVKVTVMAMLLDRLQPIQNQHPSLEHYPNLHSGLTKNHLPWCQMVCPKLV
jgi:hypothetical protein